jgi:hypothetical protein
MLLLVFLAIKLHFATVVQAAPVEFMEESDAVSVSAFCQQITASLFQAVLAASISVVFIACCYALKSTFGNKNCEFPEFGKRGYSVRNYFRDFQFERKNNVTRIDPVPLWQVPPLKSHRTNRWKEKNRFEDLYVLAKNKGWKNTRLVPIVLNTREKSDRFFFLWNKPLYIFHWRTTRQKRAIN